MQMRLRGCLISGIVAIVAAIGGCSWLASKANGDPIAMLYILADANGSLSKWDDRTALVQTVSRNCTEQKTPFDLQPIKCQSRDALLQALKIAKKPDYVPSICENESDERYYLVCFDKERFAKNGTATLGVQVMLDNGTTIPTSVNITSQRADFYHLEPDDKLTVSVCRANPRIVRDSDNIKWLGVEGC